MEFVDKEIVMLPNMKLVVYLTNGQVVELFENGATFTQASLNGPVAGWIKGTEPMR